MNFIQNARVLLILTNLYLINADTIFLSHFDFITNSQPDIKSLLLPDHQACNPNGCLKPGKFYFVFDDSIECPVGQHWIEAKKAYIDQKGKIRVGSLTGVMDPTLEDESFIENCHRKPQRSPITETKPTSFRRYATWLIILALTLYIVFDIAFYRWLTEYLHNRKKNKEIQEFHYHPDMKPASPSIYSLVHHKEKAERAICQDCGLPEPIMCETCGLPELEICEICGLPEVGPEKVEQVLVVDLVATKRLF